MIDTYLKSRSKEALEALVAEVAADALPIRQGRAQQTTMNEEGNLVTLPACGESDMFYTCIRAPDPVAPRDDVEVCSPQEAARVCGVWA